MGPLLERLIYGRGGYKKFLMDREWARKKLRRPEWASKHFFPEKIFEAGAVFLLILQHLTNSSPLKTRKVPP